MADAATISVLLTAKDEASAMLKKVGDNMKGLGSTFAQHGKQIGVGLMAAGAGIEMLAQKQQALTESTRKLAHQTGLTEKEIRGMATSLSNATFPLESALRLMELGSQQGLESAEALKKYANFWDMIGDATGASAEKMAKMGASLAAVGIEVGNETELLGAFGLISRETVGTVAEFIKGISLLAPEMAAMGMSVDDAAVIMTAMEREMGLVGRIARTELKEALEQTETGMAGVLEQLGLNQTQLDKWRGKLLESGNVMGDHAQIVMDSKTTMEKLKSSMDDLIFTHGGLIEKAAILAPLLLAAPPLIAGVTFAMTALEPVIFRVRLAMIGLNLSMGVIAAVILAVGLAITAGILIWKNWDTVVEKTRMVMKKTWEGILKFTEVAANFIIGILNKLTIVWRKQFELIATIVVKLLDLGSKLPFVGDSFEDAAGKIEGFSDMLRDGIPQIDITKNSQEELQRVVEETAATTANGAAVIGDSNTAIANSTEAMVQDVSGQYAVQTQKAGARTAEVIASDKKLIASGEQVSYFTNLNAEHAKISSDKVISAKWAERDAFIQSNKDAIAAGSAEREARDANLAALVSSLSETNQQWKESGATVEEVMKLWSQSTDQSFDEIAADLRTFGTDINDAESLTGAFTRGTGQNFFDMKDDIALALEQASRTVEEKMADMGRIMSGSSFTNAAGQSLGLGQGGMKAFQSMTSGEQVAGIQGAAGEILSKQNLVDLTGGGGAVAGAAIDLIQGRWENDKVRLANEKVLLDGGYGEVDGGIRTQARNSINDHLRMLKAGRYPNLQLLSRDMTHEGAWGQTGDPSPMSIANQLVRQKYGQEKEILQLYTSGAVTAFASGGIVTKPTLGLVGEAGPEAIIPLGRGGGMGTTNNFHFHGAVYGVEDLKEAVVEAVRDHAISGGFSGVFAKA